MPPRLPTLPPAGIVPNLGVPLPPRPTIMPPSGDRNPPPIVGVGGSNAPSGQAPVMHISNSVVNVGQQRVNTQANSSAQDSNPTGTPTVDDLGPPSPPPPISSAMGDSGDGLPPFRPTSTPDSAGKPSPHSLGPVWSPDEGVYR